MFQLKYLFTYRILYVTSKEKKKSSISRIISRYDVLWGYPYWKWVVLDFSLCFSYKGELNPVINVGAVGVWVSAIYISSNLHNSLTDSHVVLLCHNVVRATRFSKAGKVSNHQSLVVWSCTSFGEVGKKYKIQAWWKRMVSNWYHTAAGSGWILQNCIFWWILIWNACTYLSLGIEVPGYVDKMVQNQYKMLMLVCGW